jgi:twitching motility protein PilT
MGSSLRTKESIQLGESEGKSFYEIIEASFPFGWRTFDQSCLEAYERGIITEETAVLFASRRGPVTRGIDNIKKRRGQNTSNVDDLRMAAPPEPAAAPPPAPAKSSGKASAKPASTRAPALTLKFK